MSQTKESNTRGQPLLEQNEDKIDQNKLIALAKERNKGNPEVRKMLLL